MQAGKLPHDLLLRLLAGIERRDPRVLVWPAVGEDAAVITVGDRILVAKTDPVTFATDRIGWYAVHINANDVAATGVKPAWFLATLLLPETATPGLAEDIFQQINAACRMLDIALVGGHSEITIGLDRPIVIGAMLGEAPAGVFRRTADAQPGDVLILTKGIAIEGTVVLAREAGDTLQAAGVSPALIARAAALLDRPGISVVAEALHAAAVPGVHAMHDPTEGGLATALHELAQAAGVGLRIDRAQVRVLPETAALCAALGLDPLGLLASGALLIAATPEAGAHLLEIFTTCGIDAALIGSVTLPAEGVIIRENTGAAPLPMFARDELARFFETDRQTGSCP